MENQDTIYGLHAVTETMRLGMANKLYIQKDLKGQQVDKMKALASEKRVGVSFVDKKTLDTMTDSGVHQGFVVRASSYVYQELSPLLQQLEASENPMLLILDGITDPHNFGAIIRSACATGVSGIIIGKHRQVGVTPIVAKTSTGAINHMPIVRVTNLSQTIDRLKDVGFWVFGTDMDGTPHYKWQTQGKIALVIGSEGAGMSQNLKKKVDDVVTIPMRGEIQSLNASVAAALLMYKWYENTLL